MIEHPADGEWWIVEDPRTRERTVAHCVRLERGLAWELMEHMMPLDFDLRLPLQRVEVERAEALTVKRAIERGHDSERVQIALAGMEVLKPTTADRFALAALCIATGLQAVPEAERPAYLAGVLALAREAMEAPPAS